MIVQGFSKADKISFSFKSQMILKFLKHNSHSIHDNKMYGRHAEAFKHHVVRRRDNGDLLRTKYA